MRIGKRYISKGVRHDHDVCDVCDERCDRERGGWTVNDVTLRARLGEMFPEGDLRDYYDIEVCPHCFLDKVKPAIEALGCTFRVCGADDAAYDRIDPEDHSPDQTL